MRSSSSILWPILLAALAAAGPGRAGEAHAPFTITVRVDSPLDNCLAAAEGPSTLVTCGAPPQVAQVVLVDDLVFRESQKLGAAGAGALYFHTTSSGGWGSWGSAQLYGEYSTRLVQADGVEYLEMLLSW